MNIKIKIPSFSIKEEQLIQWFAVLGIYMPIMIFNISIKLILESLCIIIAVLLIYKKSGVLKVSKGIFFLFLFLFLSSLISILINNYPYSRFIQQILMLLFYIVGYYIIFREIKTALDDVFSKYLKLSYYIALLAIIQECVFLLTGISLFKIFTYDRDILAGPFVRVNVFAGEPSNLATLLTPAFVYYLLSFKNNVKSFFTIFIAVIFTFSTTSLLIIILAMIYRLIFQSGIFVKILFFSFIIFFVSLCFSSDRIGPSNTENNSALQDIILKIDETVDGLSNISPKEIELLNMSSYATLMNVYIALNAPTRLIGTGLGTHPNSYELLYQSNIEYYGLNKNDAYSMLVRIYSEFGLLGIVLILFFILKNYNKYSNTNISVLFILISLMIRGGHYTLSGTIFFFFIYYYTSYKFKKSEIL